MTTVCIGDSITAGQHCSDAAWPAIIGAVAKGVPGDTTRLALERFPRDVQALEPDRVIIQFGHNDANRWATDRGMHRVSPEAFTANLYEMVERCRKFGAAPYLCSLTPSRLSDQHATDARDYDNLVRYVARMKGVPLIDVSGLGDGALMDDGLHLTAEGHRRYADLVTAALG